MRLICTICKDQIFDNLLDHYKDFHEQLYKQIQERGVYERKTDHPGSFNTSLVHRRHIRTVK